MQVDVPIKSDSFVLREWKSEMRRAIKARYGDRFTKNEIDAKLDRIIQKRLKNPAITVYNNYTNTAVRTNVLDYTDTIQNCGLVITGGGCTFVPHGTKPNILIDFIQTIMGRRKTAKNERKKYEKHTPEWLHWDIAQLLNKLVINSLYGCLGYPGFLLYNVFTAEAITNEGKHIITSAINALEGFLGDAMYFVTENEMYHFLNNVHTEYKEKYKGMDITAFPKCNWVQLTYDRIISKCPFDMTQKTRDALLDILTNRDEAELILLYYKNNLLEFSQLPFIKEKYKYIVENNGVLTFCEMRLLKDDEMRRVTNEIWNFYEVFVLYNYPIHDRIRKAAYLPKSRCLYTDTDSVFISLSHFVNYVRNDVCHGQNPMETWDDLRFTTVNLVLIFVGIAVDRALKTLCSSSNIPPEWAEKLTMKNEFYLRRILFMMKKKRYISLSVLQEGQILGGGIGLPEIKGLDFIKSTTKPYLKDYFTKVATEEILMTPDVSPSRIFKKMVDLKNEIEYDIRHGGTRFHKQSKVKGIEHYKNPYSTQGVTAVMLWNALVPQAQIELPADVNIVPIKSMTMAHPSKERVRLNQMIQVEPLKNANVAEFAEKYPEAYERLYREIYCNENPAIRHMTLGSIALPKNTEIEVPDYIYSIINYDDIVNNALMLFLPVTEVIGLNSLPTTSKTSHISNIVEL